MIPFAVVGSERNVIIDGKPVRGRKNRWGVINVENEQHCEFNYLRNFLTRYAFSFPFFSLSPYSSILTWVYSLTREFWFGMVNLLRTHLQDLIETTAQIHYEAFRSKQLLALKESSANKQQAQSSQPIA